MTTEQTPPPAVILSTAQLWRFEKALSSYWDCAYKEGHLNRPDGETANAILHEIRCALRELVAAEREACAAKVAENHGWIDGVYFDDLGDALRSNAEVSAF